MKKEIDQYLGYFLVFLMVIMLLDVLLGVLTRHILARQIDWTVELARFLLIWVGILGAAYASGQKMHLAIDLLSPRISPANQQKLFFSIQILIILFALLVMVVGGCQLLYISHKLGQLSPSLRIPMTLVYAVLPFSGILVIYYKVNELLERQPKN